MQQNKLLTLLIFICSLLICNMSFADNIKPYTDNTKSISVTKENPQFTILLAANPTTGYTWMVNQYDSNLIKVVGHKYNPPISQIVGAGGIDVWTFEIKPIAFAAPHVLKIKMLYARAWNVDENSTTKEFTVVTH